jgi:hypothetical protein
MTGTYEVHQAVLKGQSHFVRVTVRNADGVEQTIDNTPYTYHAPMWDDATQSMIMWVDQTSGTYDSKKDAAAAVRSLRKLGYVKAKS